MKSTCDNDMPMSNNSLTVMTKMLQEGSMLSGGSFSIDMSLALNQQACNELMDVINRAKERVVD